VKSLISIVCGVVLSVFALPALASAQEVHAASSKKIEVHFSTSTLDKKVQESEFRTTRRTDGTQVLTSVRFKGETAAHTVAIS